MSSLQKCVSCGREFKNLKLHLSRSACGTSADRGAERTSEATFKRAPPPASPVPASPVPASPVPASPTLTKCAWGVLETSAGVAGKDLKLFPGGARAWDWRETGTRHVPGIQPADVQELLNNGATHVVLSRGFDKILQTPRETFAWLESLGVGYTWEETPKAAKTYNRLAKSGAAVGGLFHSTC